MNPFEADIHDALVAKGLSIMPQWGASRYRIDLAVKHPKKPGHFVLAIECDGATYHSAPTARDRDRLRQQQLEALGWRFHRIWSQDWFLRREQEIQRTLDAYSNALRSEEIQNSDAHDSVKLNATAKESTAIRRPVRSQRPEVPMYDEIDSYRENELLQLLEWIISDGCLRTDDELVAAMVETMGFKRKGPRIVARIKDAMERMRVIRRKQREK
jgi:very-short-patch-repair endonuclease